MKLCYYELDYSCLDKICVDTTTDLTVKAKKLTVLNKHFMIFARGEEVLGTITAEFDVSKCPPEFQHVAFSICFSSRTFDTREKWNVY